MRNQIGSSLLAAAASLLVVGMVAIGSAAPAQAWSEEDLAAPHGSFTSDMAAPNNVPAIYRAQNFSLNVGTNEEDLAAPHGSFVSTMVAPDIHQGVVKLADGAEPDDYQVNLSTIVAASLE